MKKTEKKSRSIRCLLQTAVILFIAVQTAAYLTVIGLLNLGWLSADGQRLEYFLTGIILVTVLSGGLMVLWIRRRITVPIEGFMEDLRKFNPLQEMSFKQTCIKELDEMVSAVELLGTGVTDASERLSQLLDMGNLRLGAIAYEMDSKDLFCTNKVFDILDFTSEFRSAQKKEESEMLLEFERFQSRVVNKKTAEDGASVLSFYVEGEKRWVRFLAEDRNRLRMVVVQDVTRDIAELEKLEYERDYDVLTNLLNRRAFRRKAEKIVGEGSYPLVAAAMWDLDNLKFVNDQYGHDYGDRYIQEAAKILGRIQSETSLVCRRSGDEFIVLLYGEVTREKCLSILRRVHKRLRESSIQLPDGNRVKLRASGGVAFYPEDGADYRSLMQYMDFAMYNAKHTVKGSFRVFDRKLYDRDKLLLSGTGALDRLFEEEAVRYVFHPIVSAVDGEVFGYEALMRPQIPELKSPADVLRLAKAQSKLYQVERLTWNGALRDYAPQAEAAGDKYIFLNSIPNTHLLPEDTEKLEEQYGACMNHLVIEIIESEQLMPEELDKKREQCVRWGGRIALDDYGTGYSTDSTLLALHPEYIKLDISIVTGIDQDRDRQALVSNLLQFARPRGIKVIAEGVETKGEMQLLIRIGVDYLQGFYLARPSLEIQDIPEERKREIRAYREKAGLTS